MRPAQRYDDFKLIRITCQAACHGKTEHGILSSLKNRAKLLLSSLPVSPSRVLRAPGTSSYHLVPKHLRATWPRPEQSHLLPEACSPNGTDKFLRPAQRYDDFKLIRITCQAACHGKTEHGILSSLKNRAKLLLSSLPVSPSRVLRAPGTSSYHLVPKHLRATWPRPEQSHLLPEACSPNGTDKFLRPAQRYDDFKLIRITCQAACHGKTEHGILSSLKNRAKLLLSSLPVSPSRVLRGWHIIVPFGAEAPSGHVAQA